MPAGTRSQEWQFGNAVLDGGSLELRVGGEQVSLEPKPLELLLCLLQHPGEVVTKDELLDAVWPGRVVTEGVLVKAVAKLRMALRDDDAQIVRTVHGYGYRLVADVRVCATARALPAGSTLSLQAGDRVPARPNWTLVRLLGEGGQGEVWLAEHAKTRECRVFKFARDGHGLAALKREITLFRLLHDTLGERSDLVPLLDWNLDEPPYFLESAWSPAGSLLDWSESIGGLAAVALDQRLVLAAQVADALAAAHGVGVLHKDLKPGNVLVEIGPDGAPRARLGDFGSGRVLDPQQLEALGITRLGYTRTVLDATGPTSGTPLYLAPEIMAGHAPTMRSDIYALGVLLWQLAIGDLRRPLAPGWERAIDDPILRDDIAACVDGDPQRRLADAGELARRLDSLDERHRERAQAEALAERLQSAQRQTERLRRKRRLALVVATVSMLALAVSLVFFDQARRARDQSDADAARAQAVTDYLVRDLLGGSDPYAGAGELTLASALERAESAVAGRFPGQPRLEASVRLTLASAFLGLGDTARAAAQLDQARQRLGEGPMPGDVLETEARVLEAKLHVERNAFDEARVALGEVDPAALHPTASAMAFERASLAAYVALRTQPADDVLEIYQDLLPRFVARFGEHSEQVQSLMRSQAEALDNSGEVDAALALHRVIHQRSVDMYGADDLRTVKYLRSVAIAEHRLGRYPDALESSRHALDILSSTLGDDHLHTLEAQSDVAAVHVALGQLDAADELNARALAKARTGHGPVHDVIALLLNGRALVEQARGRLDEAIAASREAHAQLLALYGEAHAKTLHVGHSLSRLLQEAGDWPAAEKLQRDLLVQAVTVFKDDHWQLGQLRASLGVSLLQDDDPAPGLALLDQGLTAMLASLGAEHPQVVRLRDIAARHRLRAKAID
jgi:DNA-binding winged helix-turn-helix (wHTH) protein/tetratricopeptide (TPR) repeat protein